MMKGFKRIAAAAMAAIMLTGCGGNSGGGAGSPAAGGNSGGGGGASSPAAGGKVYNIGVCQLVEHVALDAATQGFKDALIEKLGEANVKFDVQNAQGESTNCANICTGFVSGNCDLILANATPALQSAAAATNYIPIIGTSITDYATALDIDNWTGKTGTNITGTSDLAPIDQQEDMLQELFPNVKQVGILYCSAEPNSKYQATKFEEALAADGIAFKEYSAADSNEIQSVVTSAVSECDVLYVPTDNTMASSTEVIKNIVLPAKIPVIAGEQGICEGCGVATLSISYYDLGYKSGEMAYDILVNGQKPGEMDISFAPNVSKLYNAQICSELGITPPEGYTPIN